MVSMSKRGASIRKSQRGAYPENQRQTSVTKHKDRDSEARNGASLLVKKIG